jgi:hypothetical protein
MNAQLARRGKQSDNTAKYIIFGVTMVINDKDFKYTKALMMATEADVGMHY